MRELAPGLRRWTARHPDWEEDVASLAVETGDGLVLIDPLAPPAEVVGAEHVLLTVYWHYRSTRELASARVWAPSRSAQPLRNRGVEVAEPIHRGDELPGGIEAFETPRVSELVYWLPEHRTVVVGDVLLGAGAKPRPTAEPLRLCPERWLGKGTHAELRRALAPLLQLPVERVLVAHGEPVLEDGLAPLRAVL